MVLVCAMNVRMTMPMVVRTICLALLRGWRLLTNPPHLVIRDHRLWP